jgi:hypothetical protein
MTMRICPFDLEQCAMPECAGGHCEKTGEPALAPCAECGVLIVFQGLLICVDCTATETVNPGSN